MENKTNTTAGRSPLRVYCKNCGAPAGFDIINQTYRCQSCGGVTGIEEANDSVYQWKMLPPAIIGMLVVYCLRNTAISFSPFGTPELISIIVIAFLQAWKRNSLISILSGTAVYMFLTRILI